MDLGNASGRLIVVSNRLPIAWRRQPDRGWSAAPGDGGLVSALSPVLEACGGIWVGWPGVSERTTPDLRNALDRAEADMGIRFEPLLLDAREVRGFYRGFSNQILWPLFHDLFVSCDFDSDYWGVYQKVNEKAAELVARIADSDDFIWVQDYHFLTVARELRRLRVSNRLGFFLHTPFPAPDTFLRLPWRRPILDALLKFDLVGFQAPRDRRNFLECVETLNAASAEPGPQHGVLRLRSATGSPVQVGCFPISIDFEAFRRLAEEESVSRIAARLAADLRGQRILLGVDRLDYTKGLPHKIRAFRRALELHAELRERVTLVQHVVPSRESNPSYRNLRLEIERLVGEVNGRFGTPRWTPVRYFYHRLDPRELSAFYLLADAILVTSLKDGMNLVSKEYCASKSGGQGVLVLSEFAGAAVELGCGALLVNPHDRDGLAEAIHRAVTMPAEERRERMNLLGAVVRNYDVFDWVASYLCAVGAAPMRAGRGRIEARGPETSGRETKRTAIAFGVTEGRSYGHEGKGKQTGASSEASSVPAR